MNKLITIGLVTFLLVSIVIAVETDFENLLINSLEPSIQEQINKIMNSMTPQEALALRIKQIAEENHDKSSELKAESLE